MVLESGLLVEDAGRYRLDGHFHRSPFRQRCGTRSWRGSTGWRRSGGTDRPLPLAATSHTRCCDVLQGAMIWR